jgi:hypothetical protein
MALRFDPKTGKLINELTNNSGNYSGNSGSNASKRKSGLLNIIVTTLLSLLLIIFIVYASVNFPYWKNEYYYYDRYSDPYRDFGPGTDLTTCSNITTFNNLLSNEQFNYLITHDIFDPKDCKWIDEKYMDLCPPISSCYISEIIGKNNYLYLCILDKSTNKSCGCRPKFRIFK